MVARQIREAYEKGKTHALVVIAEGASYNAEKLARYFREHCELGFELRVTILGHVQRSGVTAALDRLLATRFGAAATDCLAQGEQGVRVGLIKGDIATTPLEVVASSKKPLDLSLWDLVRC